MNNLRFISSTFDCKCDLEHTLIPDLEKFNLPYHIYEFNHILSIQKAMIDFPDQNIIWLNPQSKINTHPNLLFQIPDYVHLGVNYIDYSELFGPGKHISKEFELNINTLYIKNNMAIVPFMEEWLERYENTNNLVPELYKMIIEQSKENLQLFLIPREYSYISHRMSGELPFKPCQKPVISHFNNKIG